jgi:uncharacterized lipoprotein YddW (UPF0748 family)
VIKLKKLLLVVLLSVFLNSCDTETVHKKEIYVDKTVSVAEIKLFAETTEHETYEDQKISAFLNAIWVSQFDMHPIYRDGNMQREFADYKEKVDILTDNLIYDGFDTVFLQVRPNGDSMLESDFYPNSKYIAGSYGGEIEYDAISAFLEIARSKGLSVHAWVNPFRLCGEIELVNYGKGQLFEWYSLGLGKRIELGGDGLLYLDPSYEEATELIVNGVSEILNRYDFDGIHFDDYFYPTEFEFDDEREFLLSGYSDIGEFRRANIDRTVKAVCEAVHAYGKVFGVAPAGNIYSLTNGWYVDIYKWLSSDGYVDYIMPQLYYGFSNATCPFERVLKDWKNAVKNGNIKLYIGLSAAKCALGSKGVEDTYAGESGKYEWRDNKDILKRSLECIVNTKADGVCIFTYSSFYDPLSGVGNEYTADERNAFCESIKNRTE